MNNIKICRECGNEYREDLPMCPNCTNHYNEVYGFQKSQKKSIKTKTSYPNPTKYIITFLLLISQLVIWPNINNFINNMRNNNVSTEIQRTYRELVLNKDIIVEYSNERLILTGQIFNPNSKQINGAMITIAIYNADNDILDTSSDFINQIPANSNWEFDVKFYNVTNDVTHYQVINIVGNYD